MTRRPFPSFSTIGRSPAASSARPAFQASIGTTSAAATASFLLMTLPLTGTGVIKSRPVSEQELDCTTCGACCFGHKVVLYPPDEARLGADEVLALTQLDEAAVERTMRRAGD